MQLQISTQRFRVLITGTLTIFDYNRICKVIKDLQIQNKTIGGFRYGK
jgi:hypothetical protein